MQLLIEATQALCELTQLTIIFLSLFIWIVSLRIHLRRHYRFNKIF